MNGADNSTDRFRFMLAGFAMWLAGTSVLTGTASTASAQSVRLAVGTKPANEPKAHLRNLSTAVWSRSMDVETPTRTPIWLLSGYTTYPFGRYGTHGRYPFGTQYYDYGPTLSYRSYGQYPVPSTDPPPSTGYVVPPWAIGRGYWPGAWGYGWNGYGYGAYAPTTWSYGGWGATVPAGWGYAPVAPTWGQPVAAPHGW